MLCSRVVAPLLACVLVATACGADGTVGAAVVIDAPLDGTQVEAGSEVTLRITVGSGFEIDRIEIRIDDEVVQTAVGPGESGAVFVQTYTPSQPGQQTLTAVAYRVDGAVVGSAQIELNVAAAATPSTVTTAQAATTSVPANTSVATDGCSASGMTDVIDQPGFPQVVGETRRAIIAAASSCDYGLLETLASGQPEFVYSFGAAPGSAGFAALLSELEGLGDRPLDVLVTLLNSPFGTIDSAGAPLYVWPSAYAFDDWASVPQADRDAISVLYGGHFDDYDFENAYLGGRVGITEAGLWNFFITGGD